MPRSRTSSSPRIHVLVARAARRAVVLRRGPSKQVLMLAWDLASDRLEQGQWLKGRVYERRCDLSPSGERLVYFAAKYRGLDTFTAISRPPYFTALALWPGFGTWGGGGLFTDERTLELNHRSVTPPSHGSLHRSFRVEPLGTHSGKGEDNPLWHTRLLRDGWVLKQPGGLDLRGRSLSGTKTRFAGGEAKVWAPIEPATIYAKKRAAKPGRWLEMRIGGLHEIDGPWYLIEHALTDDAGRELASLGLSDWADWDPGTGDLLFARDGRLFRLARQKVDAPGAARELADLRALRFTPREPPKWAREWLGARR